MHLFVVEVDISPGSGGWRLQPGACSPEQGSRAAGQRGAQSEFEAALVRRPQAAPAAHKRSSDPGMKRERKVKAGRHKGAAKWGKSAEKCCELGVKGATSQRRSEKTEGRAAAHPPAMDGDFSFF